MKFKQHLRIVSAATVGAAVLLAGCAGSNANRASRQSAGQVSFDTAREKAEELALKLNRNPRFVKFREAAEERGEELAMLLSMKVENDTDTSGRFAASVGDFKSFLPESFYSIGVGEFRDVSTGKGADSELLEEFDQQDFSDDFDQDTGDVTTGGAAKAVLLMQAVGSRKEIRGGSSSKPSYEILMRVRILDGKRKTEIWSGSVNWTS
jgi:hypothetical protein